MRNKDKILIQDARVIDPASGTDCIRDLYIEDGILRSLPNAVTPGMTVYDATGLIVCPGFIDIHVHLREPGHDAAETVASGTRAAACGGFTKVVAMPNTTPAMDCPEQIRRLIDAASLDSPVTVLPSVCISKNRAGREPVDYAAAREAGAVAITDDGSTPVSLELMQHAAREAARLNLPILDHAEDHDHPAKGVMHEGAYSKQYRLPGMPSEVETSIVARDIELARETGCRMHIQHISARESIRLVCAARAEGLPVTAEATPHHLALTDADVDPANAHYKMNPPLRSAADRDALLQAVADGIITILATDHAPHTADAKARGFRDAPFGIIGLETALGVTYTQLVLAGYLDISRWVACWTTHPAALLNLAVPTIQENQPAELTLINPSAIWTVPASGFASKSVNTPFAGTQLTGRAVTTLHHA
jgi:dihydroorotase